MALLGKGKKKKKSGGILNTLGIQAEKAPSKQVAADKVRQEQIIKAWNWLRRQIDRGVEEYFISGDRQRLQKCVGRPASDSMITQLEQLRSQGIRWSQPDRNTQTNPKVELIHERLNEHQQPVEFTVQERFKDYSVYAIGQDEKRCDGTERVIQATVEVIDGQHYRLLKVIEVHGATL